MRLRRIWGFILFFTLATVTSAFAAEETLKLKILFTHDLHSHFDGVKLPGNDGVLGGYGRLCTAVNKERSDKDFITILVDGGDFAMGTLYQTLYTSEAAEISLMTKIGYDIGTFGNHEFDFGPSGLAQMLGVAKAKNKNPMPLVSSNISFAQATDKNSRYLKSAFKEYHVKDTRIIERGGIKIGFLGLVGKDAASDVAHKAPGFFADPIQSAAKAVEKLKKQGADIIICLSHSGTVKDKENSEDEILASKVPEIDFILSGHSHTLLEKPILTGNTVIGSCGYFGQNLGVAEFEFKDKKPKFSGYRIIPLDDKISSDPKIQKEIEHYRGLLDKKYLTYYGYKFDQQIAYLPFDFPARDEVYENSAWESSLGDLVTDAFLYSVRKAEGPKNHSVDIAVEAQGLIRGNFIKGVISVPDVFEMLPLGLGKDGKAGYPLVTFYITGEEVYKMLEFGPTLAPMGKADKWLMCSGLKYTFDLSKPEFKRVASAEIINPEGSTRPIEKEKLYRVCMCSYLAGMCEHAKEISNGIINIRPRNASGRVIKRPKSVGCPEGAELKEWVALAEYLSSFPVTEKEKLPVIPERYKVSQGRAMPVKQ